MTVPEIRSTTMNAYRIVVPSLAVHALAAGCSSGGASAQPQQRDNGGYGRGGGNRPGGMPGVNGKIAAIDGSTLQVQGATDQTAVTYSAATKFTETVAGSKSDVVAGACVTVRPVAASPAPPAGSGVQAGVVTVSAPVGGKCGFGGPGGAGPRGAGPGGAGPGGAGPSGRPSVRPSGPRSGGPRGGRGAGFGASGTVKDVTASGFTVSRPDGSAPVTVTVSGTTAFTRTAAATKAALAVGKCVTAFGKADDSGTVAATAIAVRPAENGQCAFGFGGRGRGSNGGN
jgi:hypothetical protein